VTLVYLDASAIVKLVRPEPETRELFEFLRSWPERVTSVISAVEVPRAVRRAAGSARGLRRADAVLARLGLVELDVGIRARAAALEPSGLRTLDAIHVATAVELGDDVSGVVTYDERQAAATRRARIDVYSPGRA
jgi:predicted nucleic acid-binding protein